MGKNKEENSVVESKVKKFFLPVLLILLFLSNIFTLIFFIQKEKIVSGVAEDQYNLLNPARHLLQKNDLIINFQPLRDYINNKYGADLNISIYFEYLPTGANISINKDAEFYPASLLKVPVAMAVAKKIEKGDWQWTNELVLMSTDKDNKFGTLYKEPTNSTHTIEDLARRSLSDSDNSAHFMLVRNLEIEEMKDVYDHMGLDGFLETEGNLSAKKYSIIFRALYNSSYLTEESSQKLLFYLSHSPFNYYIQKGLPQNIIFAHKIGVDTDKKIYLDSGIVYVQNRPYILTILTKNKDEQKAEEIMEDISKNTYNYVNDYKD
ncbi:MAG: serine hydrolase [Patescibacteria group bacterium]|jgi:beta-lactamase class A